MLDCLNDPQVFIAFLTAVNALISIVNAYTSISTSKSNEKMAKAAQEQTETAKQQMAEMIRQYNESHRPFVIISFETIRSGLHCFKIENIGPVVATNVKIRINDEFLDNLDKNSDVHHLRGITETTLMLSSYQKLFIALSGPTVFNKISGVPAKIDISYNGKYEEHTEIDLKQYQNILLYKSELGDISQDIKDIVKNLNQVEIETSYYHNKLIDAITKINPVSFLVNTGYERRKFETYKAVCLNPNSTAEQIAAIVEISKEDALEILKELESVDKLVQAVKSKGDDDDFHAKWRRW